MSDLHYFKRRYSLVNNRHIYQRVPPSQSDVRTAFAYPSERPVQQRPLLGQLTSAPLKRGFLKKSKYYVLMLCSLRLTFP